MGRKSCWNVSLPQGPPFWGSFIFMKSAAGRKKGINFDSIFIGYHYGLFEISFSKNSYYQEINQLICDTNLTSVDWFLYGTSFYEFGKFVRYWCWLKQKLRLVKQISFVFRYRLFLYSKTCGRRFIKSVYHFRKWRYRAC